MLILQVSVMQKSKYGLKRVCNYLLRVIKAFGGDRFSQSSYSQEGEDLILQRIFDSKSSGFYVDVGACHPMRFSNTFIFYKKGWRGINIEPNPEAVTLFKRDRPLDINLNCGAAPKSSSMKYYMFDEPALNTFSADVATQRITQTNYKLIAEKDVEVLPLKQILQSYLPENTSIDFMSIDVEGLDLQVLESNDWGKYHPGWVLVEQLNLQNIEDLDFDIHHFMKSKGYELFAKTFNTLFYKSKVTVS